jgi:hypothetical protein
VARLLFWACVFLLLYVHVLYPLAIRMLEVLLGSRAVERTLEAASLELTLTRSELSIRSLTALIRDRRFLNLFAHGPVALRVWWQVLLYASPLLWFGAFVANVALARDPPPGESYLYIVLLIGQTSLLVAGLVGFMLQTHQRQLGVFGKPYRLLLTNLASLIAILRKRIWVPQLRIPASLLAYLVLRHLIAAPDAPDAAMSHLRSHHHVPPRVAATELDRPDR